MSSEDEKKTGDTKEIALGAWSSIWDGFWFLRGALLLIPAISLGSYVFDLSKIDVLTALHAVVLSWFSVAEWVGRFVGRIPFVPELDAAAVSFFTVCFTLISAANIKFLGANADRAWIAFALSMLSIPYVHLLDWLGWHSIKFGSGVLFVFAIAWIALIPLTRSALARRSFRRGLITSAVALITLETLYFAPRIGPVIQNWSKDVIDGEASSNRIIFEGDTAS
ncbi:MAG: hypothetical protein AAFN91_12285 [Pseudomonadota bacterium]